jgi:chromosome partitioning protein
MAKSKISKPARQIILWIAANAGGVGKTTLGIHVGYKFAQLGLKVLFIDLDTNGSLARFCGLNADLKPSETTAALFDRNFDGNYPIFTPEWGTDAGCYQCRSASVSAGDFRCPRRAIRALFSWRSVLN